MRLPSKGLSTAIISIIALTGAIVLLNKQMQDMTLDKVLQSVHAISVYQLLTCLLLTIISFMCLALYESLAVKADVGKRVPLRISLFAGVSANAIGNTLGFHVLTGGAWRYRL